MTRSGSLRRLCEDDPIKVTSVRDWPTLKNVTEDQSFMGFVNFYHRFIPNFLHVASPLHHLTKKGVMVCPLALHLSLKPHLNL